jgi:hypothetical protein
LVIARRGSVLLPGTRVTLESWALPIVVDGVLLLLPGTESDMARSPSWIVWTVGFGIETLARRFVPSD